MITRIHYRCRSRLAVLKNSVVDMPVEAAPQTDRASRLFVIDLVDVQSCRFRLRPQVRCSRWAPVREEVEQERWDPGNYWPLGGKVEGLTLPALDTRTQDREGRKAQEPSHLSRRDRLSWVERSGRTCDPVSTGILKQGQYETYRNRSDAPSAEPRPSSSTGLLLH